MRADNTAHFFHTGGLRLPVKAEIPFQLVACLSRLVSLVRKREQDQTTSGRWNISLGVSTEKKIRKEKLPGFLFFSAVSCTVTQQEVFL